VLATVDNQTAGAALDVSPDGTKLVYAVARNGRSRLMLRRIDRLESEPMPGTDDAFAPFFSSDGESIGFLTRGKLQRIAASGGTPLTVTLIPPVTRGATWSADGQIYLSPTFADPIYRVPAAGGSIQPVTAFEQGESNHLLPHALPGGAILFTVWAGGSFDDASVWLWTPGSGGKRKLIDSASGARYASSGHLIFSRGSVLLAVPFDLAKLEVTGSPVPVVDGVLTNPVNGTAEFAVSRTGTIAYVARPATPVSSALVWVDRNGREERIGEIQSTVERPRLSPDGQRVAVENLNDLWVFDMATGVFRRVTFQGVNQYPVWSRDGARLTFSRAPAGKQTALFGAPSDGGGQAAPLAPDRDPALVQFPNDWSPDGRVLAFAQVERIKVPTGDWNIFGWSADGNAVPLVNGPFKEFSPSFSPDGRWLAYVSEQSGRREVYVRPYPGPGPVVQITSNLADQPRWSRDGTELFFYHGNQFMHARVKTTLAFTASRPELLFESSYLNRYDEPGYPTFDVAPDGRRFLMIKTSGLESAPMSLAVVLNGLDELTRRTRARR